VGNWFSKKPSLPSNTSEENKREAFEYLSESSVTKTDSHEDPLIIASGSNIRTDKYPRFYDENTYSCAEAPN